MHENFDRAHGRRSAAARVTGRQAYYVDVPSAANAKDLSVVSYHAGEGMSVPYEITVEVTHPEQLTRADFLGRDAHFTITAEDGSPPRIYTGILVSLIRTKKTKEAFHYTVRKQTPTRLNRSRQPSDTSI